MGRYRQRLFVKCCIVLTSAVLLPSLTCVLKATQTVGDGLTALGSSGFLGDGGQAATAFGTGLTFLGDLIGLFSGN